MTTRDVLRWSPSKAARSMLTFDPEGLSWPQRDGDACVVCHKRWPRPRVRVGRLPDDSGVLACHDCAEALLPAPSATVLAFPAAL